MALTHHQTTIHHTDHHGGHRTGGLSPPPPPGSAQQHRIIPTTISEYEQSYEHSSAPGSRAQTPFDFIPIEEGNVYTYSHLPPDNELHYLQHEKPPPGSHLPQYLVPDHRTPKFQPHLSRRGMDILVRSCGEARHYHTARSHSPQNGTNNVMNNEEPIMLSTYPAGAPSDDPDGELKIERMDFPAPPFYYASKTRENERNRLTNGENGDDDDELDPEEAEEMRREDERMHREEEVLEKAATGIGKTFLKDLHEREKMRTELSSWKLSKFRDPRNRSRDPAGKRAPKTPLKYAGTVAPFASPSRLEDRPRVWEEWSVDDEQQQLMALGHHGAGGRPSSTTGVSILPQYCGVAVHAHSAAPRSSTLPTGVLLATTAAHAHGRAASAVPSISAQQQQQQQRSERAYAHSPLPVHEDWRNKAHSADFYGDSVSVHDRLGVHGAGVVRSTREMSPSMPAIFPPIVKSTIAEPYYRSEFFEQANAPDLQNGFEVQRSKYTADVLHTTNRNLPEEVDRKNLERHLTLDEFIDIFDMPPEEFYMQPLWKRNDMKKRAKLF